MHLGALKKEVGRDFRLVTISIPKPQEPVNENTFRFSLDRERLRQAYRRKGRYLLHSNGCSPQGKKQKGCESLNFTGLFVAW
ncbi:MAG: hypothetical protein L3J18_08295 [Candidatus Brocadia sp.]|nr:MAG: hypothetical protein L3J18_08295 [Candidatus Brocadia sp.]